MSKETNNVGVAFAITIPITTYLIEEALQNHNIQFFVGPKEKDSRVDSPFIYEGITSIKELDSLRNWIIRNCMGPGNPIIFRRRSLSMMPEYTLTSALLSSDNSRDPRPWELSTLYINEYSTQGLS